MGAGTVETGVREGVQEPGSDWAGLMLAFHVQISLFPCNFVPRSTLNS
jgi:hypothetical protein